MFHALSKEHIQEIVSIQLKYFQDRLKDKGIELEVSQQAIEALAIEGFDPVYGARPLKRAMRRSLEAPISRMIIEGSLKTGHTLSIDSGKEGFNFLAK